MKLRDSGGRIGGLRISRSNGRGVAHGFPPNRFYGGMGGSIDVSYQRIKTMLQHPEAAARMAGMPVRGGGGEGKHFFFEKRSKNLLLLLVILAYRSALGNHKSFDDRRAGSAFFQKRNASLHALAWAGAKREGQAIFGEQGEWR
jgi:hypothetical protein